MHRKACHVGFDRLDKEVILVSRISWYLKNHFDEVIR